MNILYVDQKIMKNHFYGGSIIYIATTLTLLIREIRCVRYKLKRLAHYNSNYDKKKTDKCETEPPVLKKYRVSVLFESKFNFVV